MQKDFHYDVIYVLAKWGGFSTDEAYVLAYSSQYVDDANNTGRIKFTNSASYTRTSSAHETKDLLHNANDAENHNVWLPFHFIPGNQGYERGKAPNMPFEDKLICTPDSFIARDMIKEVISKANRPNGLHRFGIALHTYADTWAHRGFIGMVTDKNKMHNIRRRNADGNLVEVDTIMNRAISEVLPLGHGPAICNPDMPFLEEWVFEFYDERGEQKYLNTEYFLVAADNIIKAMRVFLDYRKSPINFTEDLSALFDGYAGLSENQSNVLKGLFTTITSEEGNDRHNAWLQRAIDGDIPGVDVIPEYMAKGEGSWKYSALGTKLEIDIQGKPFDYQPEFLVSDWKRFHDALQEQRQYILLELLPSYGICAS